MKALNMPKVFICTRASVYGSGDEQISLTYVNLLTGESSSATCKPGDCAGEHAESLRGEYAEYRPNAFPREGGSYHPVSARYVYEEVRDYIEGAQKLEAKLLRGALDEAEKFMTDHKEEDQ